VNLNEYSSKSQSQIERAIINAQIHDPSRSENIPSLQSAFPQSRNVTSGKLPVTQSGSNLPPAIVLHFPAESEAELSARSTTSQQTNTSYYAEMQSKRKASHFVLEEQQVRKQAKKKCWKCGQTECAGRADKNRCSAACLCGLWNNNLYWKGQ
jgi:hypothetical protein